MVVATQKEQHSLNTSGGTNDSIDKVEDVFPVENSKESRPNSVLQENTRESTSVGLSRNICGALRGRVSTHRRRPSKRRSDRIRATPSFPLR